MFRINFKTNEKKFLVRSSSTVKQNMNNFCVISILFTEIKGVFKILSNVYDKAFL